MNERDEDGLPSLGGLMVEISGAGMMYNDDDEFSSQQLPTQQSPRLQLQPPSPQQGQGLSKPSPSSSPTKSQGQGQGQGVAGAGVSKGAKSVRMAPPSTTSTTPAVSNAGTPKGQAGKKGM